jgi:hypothetical protein
MKRDPETKQMRDKLLTYVEEDKAHSLKAVLRGMVEDSIRPRTGKGSFRVSPILLLLASLSAFSLGTFLYFSMVQP